MRKLKQLNSFIQQLKNNDKVDAVFLTGSFGKEKDYSVDSDLDIVVILKQNPQNIQSVFTWIDKIFSDIYFFDLNFVKKILNKKILNSNSWEVLLYSWLQKADIKFDKSGITTKLKQRKISLRVPDEDKFNYWQKINYNYITNKRYFKSKKKIYHQALQIRLLYCVAELLNGYFILRDMLWKGEKEAIMYIKNKEKKLWKHFREFTKSTTIKDKFVCYEKMLNIVLKGYPKWSKNNIIILSNQKNNFKQLNKLLKYLKKIILLNNN